MVPSSRRITPNHGTPVEKLQRAVPPDSLDIFMSTMICLYVMRTTVRLPPELLSAARRHARDTGRTFTALLEDALRLALTTERRGVERAREALPTFGSGGLLPGVDLDDGARMVDLTDEG
jgi:hypothetical protein